jgi:hypothetical protein
MGSRACREIGMEIAALAGGARAGGSAARVQGEVAHQRTRPLATGKPRAGYGGRTWWRAMVKFVWAAACC